MGMGVATLCVLSASWLCVYQQHLLQHGQSVRPETKGILVMHLVSHCSTSVVVVCAFDFAHTHMFSAYAQTPSNVYTHTHFIHMQVATT